MRRFMASLLAGLLAASGVVAVALVDAAPAAAASGPAGSFAAVTPSRVADTRTGLAGNRRGAIPAQGAATFQIAGKAGVPRGTESVALTITAVAPAATGYLVAYRAGARLPVTVTSYFTRGLTVTASTTALLSSTGRLNIANRSSGPLHVIIAVTGYVRPGRTTAPGSYGAVNPARFLDTRTGVGARRAVVGTGRAVNVQVTGRGGVPRGASAVVATLSAVSPTGPGWVVAGATGVALPSVSQLAVTAGRNVSDQVVVPLSASGAVTVRNSTRGRVHLTLDVLGYYRPGFAGQAGYISLARASRTATVGVGARRAATVTVTGSGGVPSSNVAAVVGTLTALQPRAAGSAVVYRPGTARPGIAHLSFGRAVSSADLVVVPVGADGRISIYNSAAAAVSYAFDIAGYYLASDLAVSIGHYVRSVSSAPGKFADPAATGVGCADARRGAAFVLLGIGAQLNDQTGVALSGVNTKVTYADLVSAVNAYIASYRACSGQPVTVAVGTNNDADEWKIYDATKRGRDWAVNVVNMIATTPGVTTSGAIDIESGFFSTQQQAEQWEQSFLGNTSAGLVFNGSADGCPSTFGGTFACNYGWTQAQYYRMAHGLWPGRILALPQIYNADQAVQWANIDYVGDAGASRQIDFVGALTEFGACGASCSFTPQQGWAALHDAVAVLGVTLPPAVVDLDVLS